LNTMEGSALARYCLERALELDAEYATAYARLAFNYIFHWIQRWSTTAEDSLAAVRLLCLCGFSARLFMYFAQSCTVFCSTLRMPVSENIAQKYINIFFKKICSVSFSNTPRHIPITNYLPLLTPFLVACVGSYQPTHR
jgi:hypothetical protein